MSKSIKTNALLNIIKTISSIIFPLITFPYISRILKPENIGKINFSASFVSYFSLIASLGITTYAIRECSMVREDKKELGKIGSQIFSINICTTIIAYILMFITLICFRNFDSYRTLIIIQSLAIACTTFGCDWINSAMEDFAYITFRTIGFQIISLILMFCFVKNPNDYIVYAIISLLSSSGANIVNVFYRRKYCKIKFVTEMDWKKHFKPISLLFVMILAQTIFNSSDITMLGLFKGDVEVGLYSTAIKLSHLISQIVSSLVWVVMPKLSFNFAQNNFEEINILLKKALNILLTLGLPMAIGCMLLSKEIITIIAGNEYMETAVALRILMFSFLFSLVGGSFLGNMVLLPSKKEGLYMKICCIATLVNLGLNYIFIPKWGLNAAALTTAFSSFLIMIMLIIKKDKNIKLTYIKQLLKSPLIGCCGIIIFCSIIKLTSNNLLIRTFISIFGSIIIYGLVLILFKNEICTEIISLLKNKKKEILNDR